MPDRFRALVLPCVLSALLLALACAPRAAFAGDAAPKVEGAKNPGPPEKPHQVIRDLRQRMYIIGERTGLFSEMATAEQKAVVDLRDYSTRGDPNGLVEKDGAGQTPLIAAARMGYSELVAELLKSGEVQRQINNVDSKSLSAWLVTNMAFGQAMWSCNPTMFNDPFSFVPWMVMQPYYLKSEENPYKKTRSLLERAGATKNMEQAKRWWLENCTSQNDRTRTKVQTSADVLETVISDGDEVLNAFMKLTLNKR